MERWFLVVEDNPDDEHMARRAFSTSGRTEAMVLASNGEEALELLRTRPSPAMILLDLQLPRISGVEVIIAMKDDNRLRTVPIVIFTSSNEMSDIGACYELGCNAFVHKPIEFEEVLRRFTSTLDFWLGVNLTLLESSEMLRLSALQR